MSWNHEYFGSLAKPEGGFTLTLQDTRSIHKGGFTLTLQETRSIHDSMNIQNRIYCLYLQYLKHKKYL